MTLRTRSAVRGWLVWATLLCAVLAGRPPGAAPEREGAVGPTAVRSAARTDRGNWDGTWLHVSRDFRMVIWMRTEQGKPEARLCYLGTKVPPERFETDWQGQASYTTRKAQGRFSMTFNERDENTVRGDWQWSVDFGDSSREEIGRFTLFRGGDGLVMVLAFEDFEQIQRRHDRTDRIPVQNEMVFRKVSKRLVEWDAIPI